MRYHGHGGTETVEALPQSVDTPAEPEPAPPKPHDADGAPAKRRLFTRDEYAELAERLARLKGRFVLSINDVPQIRALFAAFRLAPVELKYTMSKGKATAARELIVTPRR